LEEDRPLSLLLRWKPDLYVKGGDYASSSLKSAEAVEHYGGEVRVIASDFPTSSSKVIERIGALLRHAPPERPDSIARRGLVMLDRDGTLIRDIPFLHDPAKVELLAGVGEGLARLQAAGFALAIVTNQQGIGLGYFTEQDFIAVNQSLFRELGPFGVEIARIYYCPHSLPDRCACRKPGAAMIERALRDFQMSPERTFLIGDRDADVQAGLAASVRTFLIAEAADFSRAVDQILTSE
jgi:D-glycero-D-manno-heptose 1,7-bisphosphate phosphatase